MQKKRILYVSSEIDPFLHTSEVGKYVRKLPELMQEEGNEIRILVPRFGIINERKNRLHEVVRLSGINIAVGDEERPLVIKVASIPQAKLQVYFIDNEDYFHRKYVFTDKQEKLFDDNDERAIFFCKGVIETVRKLGWSPDIVHCNDWMAGLIPLYLKTTYKNDPLFKNTKVVYTIYDNEFEQAFDDKHLFEKVRMEDIEDDMLSSLKTSNSSSFVCVGAQYADFVVKATPEVDNRYNGLLSSVITQKKVKTVPISSEDMRETFLSIYEEIGG